MNMLRRYGQFFKVKEWICERKRYGYCSSNFPAVADLFSDADDKLFARFLNNNIHVLHSMLPKKSEQPFAC